MSKASDNPDLIELNIPPIEGGGILSLVFRLYSMLGAIISDADDSKYFKFEMMTNLIINTVLGSEDREDIKQFKKDLMAKRMAELESPSSDEINLVHMEVCMEAIGEVSSYIDKHLGVSVKLEVGTV